MSSLPSESIRIEADEVMEQWLVWRHLENGGIRSTGPGPERVADFEELEVVPAQRLSDLATAVHDWAEAHGYFEQQPYGARSHGGHVGADADSKLLDAYRRSQD